MMQIDEVDHSTRRLDREGTGVLGKQPKRTMDALTARGRSMAKWMRAAAVDRPLKSLLIVLGIGFAVGHWGPRRAER